MSKFMNYVKKFLALSFMSATASFLMSCNSNIFGIVRIVESTAYTASSETASTVKKAAGLDETKEYGIYKDKSDSQDSVLYVDTGNKIKVGDQDIPADTAVAMKDKATVKAGFWANKVGGNPAYQVTKVVAATKVSDLTLDSWNESTEIEFPTQGSDPQSLQPMLKEFTAINLTKNKTNEEGAALKDKLKNTPEKFVYDAKKGELLASSTQHSPFKNPDSLRMDSLSTGNLYASTKDTWEGFEEYLTTFLSETAANTGHLSLTSALRGSQPINIDSATDVKLQYIPGSYKVKVKQEDGSEKEEDRTFSYYEPKTSDITTLLPLSKFADEVDKLFSADPTDDTTTRCKLRLDSCVREYRKLTDTAKGASEVQFKNGEKTETCTPKEWLGTLTSAYVLSASVKNLCEHKYGKITKEAEDSILDSISNGTLSSDDKQYLISMIERNYDDLDDLYGEDIKAAVTSSVDDLKKLIQDGSSSDDKGGSDSKGSDSKGSDSSSSGGSSSKGSGSSSTSGYSSGKSGSSASIKTGSESLLTLFSSLGLSSGTLLSLIKKKKD